ncbi:uncharacterized protein LOC124167072 [Ischnura elegans]|uniref:uncharacterized protein LOC124167072 n=1 Tax=Ischnura elegans TaxID=197161 RepID=UPI001ED8A373|nr:uncharacterized protein LOC124167072 [Ischnura elegans]
MTSPVEDVSDFLTTSVIGESCCEMFYEEGIITSLIIDRFQACVIRRERPISDPMSEESDQVKESENTVIYEQAVLFELEVASRNARVCKYKVKTKRRVPFTRPDSPIHELKTEYAEEFGHAGAYENAAIPEHDAVPNHGAVTGLRVPLKLALASKCEVTSRFSLRSKYPLAFVHMAVRESVATSKRFKYKHASLKNAGAHKGKNEFEDAERPKYGQEFGRKIPPVSVVPSKRNKCKQHPMTERKSEFKNKEACENGVKLENAQEFECSIAPGRKAKPELSECKRTESFDAAFRRAVKFEDEVKSRYDEELGNSAESERAVKSKHGDYYESVSKSKCKRTLKHFSKCNRKKTPKCPCLNCFKSKEFIRKTETHVNIASSERCKSEKGAKTDRNPTKADAHGSDLKSEYAEAFGKTVSKPKNLADPEHHKLCEQAALTKRKISCKRVAASKRAVPCEDAVKSDIAEAHEFAVTSKKAANLNDTEACKHGEAVSGRIKAIVYAAGLARESAFEFTYAVQNPQQSHAITVPKEHKRRPCHFIGCLCSTLRQP